MRILLVSTSSESRGGGEIFLLYLARALRDSGHEPMLWCANHSRMDGLANSFEAFGRVMRDEYPNSYLDRRLRSFSALCDRRLITRLSRRFSAIGCDVIHLNKQTLEDGLDLFRAVQQSGKPSAATVHITQSNSSLGAFAGRLRDLVARHTLLVGNPVTWTAVSDARAAALEHFVQRPVLTIYNAVTDGEKIDREMLRSELFDSYQWPRETNLVICVARLVPQKDPRRFVALAAKLHQRDPSTRFLWIGDGVQKTDFLADVKERGLADHVKMTGWVDQPQGYLSAADLYLHPAAYEGQPLAVLEAMAAGVPCILSPQIVAETKVFNTENVLIADDSDSWIERAICPISRERFGRCSRSLYEQYFRPERLADSFLDAYRSAMR